MKQQFQFPATVNRVIDGDTVDLKLDLGFSIHLDVHIRLDGVYAPELDSDQGVATKDLLEHLLDLIKLGKHRLWVVTRYSRSFHRYVGTLMIQDLDGEKPSHNINDAINEFIISGLLYLDKELP